MKNHTLGIDRTIIVLAITVIRSLAQSTGATNFSDPRTSVYPNRFYRAHVP